MMQPTSISLLIISLFTTAYGVNDWSKPCLDGVCSYDLPASASSSGTLKIWGSKNAISDVTEAAGWEILDCSPDEVQQDIRLVCTSADPAAAGCSHLHNGGADGKIVRLPESCGKNAFARVAKSWVSADQSIPASVAKKVQRRDGKQPQVKALSLDTNFAAAGANAEPINFALQGANVKGANDDIQTTPARRSRIYGSRGLSDFVGSAIDAIKSLDEFNVDKTTSLPPLSVNKNFSIFNQKLECPPLTASLTLDAIAKADAQASVGIAATGTIIPPKVTDFGVITGFKANLDGSLNMVADLTGAADSGKVKLFETSIPGVDFPGVLTLGPSFEVNAQAIAKLDVQASMTIGLNFKIANATLVFPPSSVKAQAQGGAFNIGDTPLKLSATPDVKATGSVEAHLIPSINLKISALGAADAGIFLAMDSSATVQLSLEGNATKAATVTPRSGLKDEIDSAVGSIKDKIIGVIKDKAASILGGQNAAPAAAVGGGAAAAPAAAIGGGAAAATAGPAAPAAPAAAASALGDEINSAIGSIKDKIIGVIKGKAASILGGQNAAPAAVGGGAAAVTADPATPAAPAMAAPVLAVTNLTATTVTTSSSASFGGCFSIDAGLDVNAGAEANFFGLFDPNTKVSLVKKNFELIKKCFGNNAKRMIIPSTHRPYPLFTPSQRVKIYRAAEVTSLTKRALSCPNLGVGAAQSIADEVVSAASAKAI